MTGCLACNLTNGALPLPGGLVHETGAWRVEHCVGPLGVGTLLIKPKRHVTHLAELDAAERAEYGPLLARTAEVVQRLVEPEQVYACLWSHAGRVPGHLHVVVQPATTAALDAAGGHGPALQVAQLAAAVPPDPEAVEEFCRRARAAFAPRPVRGGLLSVTHADGRDGFLSALGAFVRAIGGLGDDRLPASSRCRGWTVADVGVHVHIGLQDMLLGTVSPTDDPPGVDAATYWRSFGPAAGGEADALGHTRFVRLLSSAYLRPSAPVAHLRVTAAALARAVAALPDGAVAFQDHVLATGDFLATWAVELAVHHLDLDLGPDGPPPDPDGLAMARRTVEALAGVPAPVGTPDVEVVLAGSGRVPATDALGALAPHLPVLG